jgi:hypothetical protein
MFWLAAYWGGRGAVLETWNLVAGAASRISSETEKDEKAH